MNSKTPFDQLIADGVMNGTGAVLTDGENNEINFSGATTGRIPSTIKAALLVKNVVVLNGPKGIGKDTLGQLLAETLGGHTVEFKSRLIDLALYVSAIGRTQWEYRYNNRELKETPWDLLGGLTQRKFLIKISEDWIKPVFGLRYFGEELLEEIDVAAEDVIVTDGGFNEEVEPLLEDPTVNLIVVQLFRDGFKYDETDSRGYITNVGQTVGVHLEHGESTAGACNILDAVQEFLV